MKIKKPAITQFPINDLATNRWSPRAFLDQPVEREKIRSLFEAARWAPSAMNEQPWHFIVGLKGDSTWNHIFESLAAGNKEWNGTVPVLILCIGQTFFRKNRSDYSLYAHDCGQALAHLSLEAMHQGLYVHPMGGFDAGKARELFAIPPSYQPLTVVAAGYIGDPEQLTGSLKDRELAERTRRDFDSFVFSGTFGQPSGLF